MTVNINPVEARHEAMAEFRYGCDLCTARFQWLIDLTLHLRKHFCEQPFECYICHARFSEVPSINIHMQMHFDKKALRLSYTNPERAKLASPGKEAKSPKSPDFVSQVDANKPSPSTNNFIIKTNVDSVANKNNSSAGLNNNRSQNLIGRGSATSQVSSNKGTTPVKKAGGKKIYKCKYCGKEFLQSYMIASHMRFLKCIQNQQQKADEDNKSNIDDDSSIIAEDSKSNLEENDFNFSEGDKNNFEQDEKNDLEEDGNFEDNDDADDVDEDENVSSNDEEKDPTFFTNKKESGLKPHQCETCKKRFKEKNQLKRHMQTHVGFKEKNQLKKYMPTPDEVATKPHSCEICEKRFRDRYHLKKHMFVHSDESDRKFQCVVCEKRFSDNYGLKKHTKTHSKQKEGTNTFVCPVCENEYEDSSLLRMHIMAHCMEMPKCAQCGSMYTKPEDLTEHIKKHEEDPSETFTPKKPEISSASSPELMDVKPVLASLKKPVAEKKAMCRVCKKTVPQKFLSLHVQSHTQRNAFTCHICKKHFSLKYSVHRHIRMVHGVIDRKYKCKVCSQSFASLIELNAHMKTHQVIKCELCDEQFSSVSEKEEHMKSHAEPQFVCSICKRKFYLNSQLMSHMDTHKLKKSSAKKRKPQEDVQCEVCKKKFSRSSDVLRHLFQHTEERPYECTMCEKKFRWRNDLKRHINRSHDSSVMSNVPDPLSFC